MALDAVFKDETTAAKLVHTHVRGTFTMIVLKIVMFYILIL